MLGFASASCIPDMAQRENFPSVCYFSLTWSLILWLSACQSLTCCDNTRSLYRKEKTTDFTKLKTHNVSQNHTQKRWHVSSHLMRQERERATCYACRSYVQPSNLQMLQILYFCFLYFCVVPFFPSVSSYQHSVHVKELPVHCQTKFGVN